MVGVLKGLERLKMLLNKDTQTESMLMLFIDFYTSGGS